MSFQLPAHGHPLRDTIDLQQLIDHRFTTLSGAINVSKHFFAEQENTAISSLNFLVLRPDKSVHLISVRPFEDRLKCALLWDFGKVV